MRSGERSRFSCLGKKVVGQKGEFVDSKKEKEKKVQRLATGQTSPCLESCIRKCENNELR